VPFTSNDQELLQTARAFLIEVEPLKKDFIQHQMPANFIRRLNAAVDDFERSTRELGSVKTRRRNGKVSVDQTLADCARLVRRLDAVVANAVIGSPPLEAEWEAARRVRRVQSRSVSGGSSPEPRKDGRSAERKLDSAQPQESLAPTENPAA